MCNLNKKGFTLVELLAVIVVLAIIMIFAIPNVMNSVDDARKGMFKNYAQKVINSAEQTYQTDILLNNAGKTCYTLSDLGLESSGNYRGKVKVTIKADQTAEFSLYLSDNSYSVSNLAASSIKNIGVENDETLKPPFANDTENTKCP